MSIYIVKNDVNKTPEIQISRDNLSYNRLSHRDRLWWSLINIELYRDRL